MKDKELVVEVMKKNGWKKIDIAKFLEIDRANVTRYVQGKQKLHPMSRKALERQL